MGSALILPALSDLAERRAGLVLASLTRGAVGLHGAPGVGVTTTLRTVVSQLHARGDPAVFVSLAEAPTPRLLLDAVVAQLEETPGAELDSAGRHLHQLRTGVSVLREAVPDDLADVLGLLKGPMTLVLDEVHRDGHGRSDSLLWPLRSFVQSREDVSLILGALSSGLDEVAGPRAAFHGYVTWEELAPLSRQEAGRAGAWGVLADELRRLLVGTRGLPGPTAATLELARTQEISLDLAWAQLLELQRDRGQPALRHAADVHTLGPALLRAISRGEKPYSAVRASRGTVHNGLTALHRAGLIVRPRPRAWAVADPFVEQALK